MNVQANLNVAQSILGLAQPLQAFGTPPIGQNLDMRMDVCPICCKYYATNNMRHVGLSLEQKWTKYRVETAAEDAQSQGF